MIVYNERKKPVYLGNQAGSGGEATVYRVRGQPGQLAKIYDRGPRPEYPSKLLWMREHSPDNPTQSLQHASLAWPMELLYDEQRRLSGYTMPFIKGAVPILEIFNPRLRAATLPQFDRRYLHRVARNLAATLSAVHQSGYVIGDLNESNILVTPSALVTIIDTDSFQVQEDRKGSPVIHYCPVGKLEYTPPELQGKSFENAFRLPEQDSFGLAVMIFQLLMEGNHPFRAQWLGKGDPPPLEARIAQGGFPYTSAPPLPVEPPKYTSGLDSLHPYLVELMLRCFVDGHRRPQIRPTPAQWERGIALAEGSLLTCFQGHIYSKHQIECPDCSAKIPGTAERPASGRQDRKGSKWKRTGTTQGHIPQPAAAQSATAPRSARAHPGRKVLRWAVSQALKPYIYTPTPAATTGLPKTPASQPSSAGPAPHPVIQFVRTWNQFWGNPASVQSSSGSSPGSSGAAASATWGSRPSWSPAAGSGRHFRVPAQMRHWRGGFWGLTKQRFSESLLYGAGQGALLGVLLCAISIAIAGALGYELSWMVLLVGGGALGGMLRGWRPGYRFGLWVNQRIGWHIFWQVIGGITGALCGLLLSIPFIFMIFPALIGLVAGGRIGVLAGRKLWLKGTPVGWERIWAGLSTVWLAFIGGMLLRWLGASGLFVPISLAADTIGTWVLAQSGSELLVWLATGALAGLVGGGTAGFVTDFSARMLGLLD